MNPPWRKRSFFSGYSSNDHQCVTDEDAASLADALEQSLADIPDHDALEHKTVIGTLPNGKTLELVDADADVSSVEWFSGNRRKRLVMGFIVFCRSGAFLID